MPGDVPSKGAWKRGQCCEHSWVRKSSNANLWIEASCPHVSRKTILAPIFRGEVLGVPLPRQTVDALQPLSIPPTVSADKTESGCTSEHLTGPKDLPIRRPKRGYESKGGPPAPPAQATAKWPREGDAPTSPGGPRCTHNGRNKSSEQRANCPNRYTHTHMFMSFSRLRTCM